jgi:hypothetical protein
VNVKYIDLSLINKKFKYFLHGVRSLIVVMRKTNISELSIRDLNER